MLLSLLNIWMPSGEKRKEKTTPFGGNLMRSQVLYRAAQVPSGDIYKVSKLLAARRLLECCLEVLKWWLGYIPCINANTGMRQKHLDLQRRFWGITVFGQEL